MQFVAIRPTNDGLCNEVHTQPKRILKVRYLNVILLSGIFISATVWLTIIEMIKRLNKFFRQ